MSCPQFGPRRGTVVFLTLCARHKARSRAQGRNPRSLGGEVSSAPVHAPVRQHSHELPALERVHISTVKFKPLPVPPLLRKPRVSVRFYTGWIVCPDNVDGLSLFGKARHSKGNVSAGSNEDILPCVAAAKLIDTWTKWGVKEGLGARIRKRQLIRPGFH